VGLFSARGKEVIRIKKDGKVVEERPVKRGPSTPGSGMLKNAEKAIRGRAGQIDRYVDKGNKRR